MCVDFKINENIICLFYPDNERTLVTRGYYFFKKSKIFNF